MLFATCAGSSGSSKPFLLYPSGSTTFGDACRPPSTTRYPHSRKPQIAARRQGTLEAALVRGANSSCGTWLLRDLFLQISDCCPLRCERKLMEGVSATVPSVPVRRDSPANLPAPGSGMRTRKVKASLPAWRDKGVPQIFSTAASSR